MATPAPHTPVNFLKAGTSMAFSAKCIALLAKAGYEPEDFGDYKHVQDRLRAAREKVNKYDGDVAAGRPTDSPPPTDHERFLASCQSGHLAQDAIHREGGSDNRGNPCANRVDGYRDTEAPCMPHQGSAQDAGTQHNEISNLETNQPRARVNPETGKPLERDQPYDPADADADADERCRQTLNNTDRPNQPTGQGQAGGQGATVGSGGADDAADASATDGASAGPVDPAAPGDIDGETAADCINAFRKHAFQAMKQNCEDSAAENRATANGGADRTNRQGAAHRSNLKRKAQAAREKEQAAKAELTSANRSRGQTERRRRESEQALNAAESNASNPPTAAQQAEIDRLDTQLGEREQSARAARQRASDAETAHDSASRTASTAQSAHSRAANALCRAQQGERLAAGRGRNNPRCPGRNRIPPTPT